MSIYRNLKGIRKLSTASLTSIVDVTNLNFKSLSEATLGFLNNINYDEGTNSFSAFKGTFLHVDISNKLSLTLDGIPTFTINAQGKAEGQELLVKVSESKRHRFTDFNDWPDVGVPGEVIYTGVQNQRPEFGEDFIGYLAGRGWVSLTSFNNAIEGLGLLIEAGSPIIMPNVPNGEGLVWIGPPGLETTYDPVSTTIYFSDDEGNHFDILTNFVWEKQGNDAKFKLPGRAIIGSDTSPGTFQYIDGNQAPGYILTSDGAGNATWAPGTGGGPLNFAYWENTSFIANVTKTITHDLGSLNVIVDFIDINTNERVGAHVDNYTANTIDVTLTETNSAVKVVVLSAGGVDYVTMQQISTDDKSWVALETFVDGDLMSNNTVSTTPINGCYVELKVNGVEYEVGNADKTKSCYFSGDGGVTARSFSSAHPNGQVQVGDKAYWNPSVAGFNINAGARISLLYLI